MKIPCMVCGELFWSIESPHLAKHNLTYKEYKEEYPTAPTCSHETFRRHSESHEGQNPWNKGLTKETDVRVAKNSENTKKNHWTRTCPEKDKAIAVLSEIGKTLIASNNPNWRGGIDSFPYPPEFNKILKGSIKKRDGYKCKLCRANGDKLGRLYIHHIDYNKENCNPENLVTLCSSCNSRMNGTRKYWKNYWRRLIS